VSNHDPPTRMGNRGRSVSLGREKKGATDRLLNARKSNTAGNASKTGEGPVTVIQRVRED